MLKLGHCGGDCSGVLFYEWRDFVAVFFAFLRAFIGSVFCFYCGRALPMLALLLIDYYASTRFLFSCFAMVVVNCGADDVA